MTDITSRRDIERLVDTFYDRVRADDMLGPIFDDVARIDWVTHLPKMYDFWETLLFGTASFKGNPLAKHLALAGQTPLSAREFDRWVTLFHECVDGLFAGAVATGAKQRAVNVAATLQQHIARTAS